MTAEFAVNYTTDANDYLFRLFDLLLSRARTIEDIDVAQLALHTQIEDDYH
jgi:hypothetical protein